MAEKNKKPVVKKARADAAKTAALKSSHDKKLIVKKKATSKKVAAKKPVTISKASIKKTAKKTTSKKPPYKKPKKDEECFLTTACVKYYNLPDNAYELDTLRKFRDTYMRAGSNGKELVKQYYSIAPALVTCINKDKEHRSVYQYIYNIIQKACTEIEQKHFAKAQRTYVSLVNTLQERYKDLPI